jgi:hypothetical protein
MKASDIIEKYLEALRTDMPDAQAKLFAKSWADASELHIESATKQDLENMMVKINAKFSIVITLGGAIFLASCLPYLTKFFGY